MLDQARKPAVTAAPGGAAAGDVRVEAARPISTATLEAAWRALEADAATDLPVFRSWTWIGALAAARFADPVLLRAEDAATGRTLGLALFNRASGGRLCLGESGDPALDAPFVEHNGPLLAADAGPEVARALLRAAWGVRGARRLVLGGVAPDLAAAAGGAAFRAQVRPAPYVDLDAVRASPGGDWLATLGSSTRYALRRSLRRLSGRGPVALDRAATVAEAHAWLDALADLHGRSWRRRGKPGAFATDFAMRFHRALLAEAVPRGEADLLRLSAGGEPVGYLYNLRRGGLVHAYQSGLDLGGEEGGHVKPGLTAHHLAVERALAAGDREYDFLGGAAAYKSALSNATRDLAWVEAVRPWSPLALAARARAALAAARARFGR